MSTRRWVALAAVAAVVGLLGAGWFVFLRTERPGRGPVGITATGPMSIWPESPFDGPDALAHAQARLDGGKDGWRLHPDEVVARFAQSVFGWVDILIEEGADPHGAGPATYRIRSDCDACGDDEEWVEVSLDRLLGERPGTVWSVVAVTSPRLHLPVEAGDTVVAGERLPFGLDLARDRHAAVGTRYVQRIGVEPSGDCGEGFAGEAAVTGSSVEVTAPDPLYGDETCTSAAGYVFAYTTPRLTVQTGDPLLEPAYVADLSIVPVRFTQDPFMPSP